MNSRASLDVKRLVLRLLFGRWRRHRRLEEGYSILLPTPADMPFLLRYALDGLRHLETNHCRQIIVIPDGKGTDDGSIHRIIESAADSRIELVQLRPAARLVTQRPRRLEAVRAAEPENNLHWAMIVEGIDAARCTYCFLHDADAFYLDADGLERQYRECRARGVDTLGVQERSDAFFEEIGYTIPGTWELMFSTRWARRRDPTTLKGHSRPSPHGQYEFDTMLYPQYLDFPSGNIAIMDVPPRFVHFASAVITYRVFRYAPRPTVVDELFRLLFLALLEDLMPGPQRALPTIAELARGLTRHTAPVTYDSPLARDEYPTFRRMIDDLCDSPMFRGSRAQTIRALLRPFDEHFRDRLHAVQAQTRVRPPLRGRKHGLSS